jgi:uncharacterized protein YceK
MRTTVFTLSLALTIFASGCGAVQNPDAASPDDVAVAEAPAKASKQASTRRAKPPEFTPASAIFEKNPLLDRKVGDFFVHRFSGSFAAEPITLTEEVIARGGALVVIDYTFEQGKTSRRLRVTHDAATDRVLRVREMAGDREIPAVVEDLEEMLAKTAFAPDANEQEIDSEKTTCLVGPHEIDCKKRSYRVAIGERTATLTVTESGAIPGRDVGGEIVDQSGKIIYRAEIIDMGRGVPEGVASAE